MFLCSCGREFQKIHGLEIHINRLRKSRPSETHERVEIMEPNPEDAPRPRRVVKVRAELPTTLVEVRISVLGTELSYEEFLKLLGEMQTIKAAMANSTKPEEAALVRQPNA